MSLSEFFGKVEVSSKDNTFTSTHTFTMLSATLMLTAALPSGEFGQNGRPHGPSSFGTCTSSKHYATLLKQRHLNVVEKKTTNGTFAALHLCFLAVPDHALDLLPIVNGVPFRTSCESSLLKAEYWCGTGPGSKPCFRVVPHFSSVCRVYQR